MVGRFYVTSIFLLTKALLPLRSEKTKTSAIKTNYSYLKDIHDQLANMALVFHYEGTEEVHDEIRD